MVLSDLGRLAYWHWQDLINHFANIELDLFVVMPNHIHAILLITDKTPKDNQTKKRPSLGVLVGSYKAAVTRNARKKSIFSGKIWQERYHDHIIRNEKSLDLIRQYVLYNPAKWSEDRYNEPQM